MNTISTKTIEIATMKNAATSRYSRARVYATEIKLECLRVLRLPSFVVPSLLFPGMFYLLFGILMSGSHRQEFATYLLCTYSIFGVMAPGLFGFGVSIAMERDGGRLTWRRALPSLSGAYFAGKVSMALLFALIIFVELALLAITMGKVQLALSQWALLFVNSVLAALPFCALGLVIGTRLSASAAPAVINFIYIPMAFLSGLWIPITQLPKFIADIAPLWPSYHSAQIALHVIGQDRGEPMLQHVAYILLFTAAMMWMAKIFWSRMALK